MKHEAFFPLTSSNSHCLQALALVLASKPSLTSLNVRENELGDRGAVALAQGVARAGQLTSLDACGNQVRLDLLLLRCREKKLTCWEAKLLQCINLFLRVGIAGSGWVLSRSVCSPVRRWLCAGR